MSLISTLAAGARASSTPRGFAGARARTALVAAAGLAAVSAAHAIAVCGAASIAADGRSASATSASVANAGRATIAVAGRPAFPAQGAAINVGASEAMVAISGLPAGAHAAVAAALSSAGISAAGAAAAPRAAVTTSPSRALIAISGLSVTANGAAGRVALSGAVQVAGYPATAVDGKTVSVTGAAGAVDAAGRSVSAGGAGLRLCGAGSVAAAGVVATASSEILASPLTSAIAAQGRPISITNGSAVIASTSAAVVLATGRQASVAISLNRIVLLGSVAAAGRPVTVSNSTSVEPNTEDGLAILSLGLADLVGQNGENPWKNYRHLLNGIGGGLKAKLEADEWDPGTGFLYVPPNTTYTIDRVRPVAAAPGNFDMDPGVWVLKATLLANSGAGGVAPTATINCPGFVNNGSAGLVIRKTEDLTGQLNGDQVTLDGGANGGRIRIDFWGPEVFEGDPDGEHPNFIQMARRYKVLRNLDWVDASGSRIVRDDQWINDTDYTIHWSSNGMLATPAAVNADRERAGFSYGRFFKICVAASAAAHCCVPFGLGGGAVEAELRGFNSIYTATQLKDACAANGAAILAQSEIEFLKHGQRIGQSAVAQNYPDRRAIFLEIGNEQWNQANTTFGRGFHYCDGLGKHLTGSYNNGRGYGAICARAFKNLRKGIHQYKPNQELVFVFGVQTAQPFGVGGTRLNQISQEIDAFIAIDAEAAPKIDCWAATTGYTSGAHKWNNARSPGTGNPWNAATESSFDAAFAASHSSDVAAHLATIKAWHLNPNSTGDGVTGMVKNNIAYRDKAHALGFGGILQYEGSSHDDPTVGTLPTTYPACRTSIVQFLSSNEGRDVQLHAIDQLRAINPTNPAKTTGWRPTELMISNYREVGRLIDPDVPWVERQTDQIVANLTTGGAAAWQQRGRYQPAGLPAITTPAAVIAAGKTATASAGSPVSRTAGAGAVAATGLPATASVGIPNLLAQWIFGDLPTLGDFETAGWIFSGDWQVIDDNGSRALFGTTGVATSPAFRTAGTGPKSARLHCSLKFGDVPAGSDVVRFIDSTTGLFAAARVAVDERLSVNRFNSATSVLSATQAQSIGAYAGFGIGFFADDAAGFVRLLQNNADNGAFTGDTQDTAPAGVDRIAFVANSGGVYIRNSVEIYSDPTGGVAGVIAAAIAAPASVAAAGIAARPAIGVAQLLASWNIQNYASVAEMQAAGFVFSSGHDWQIVTELGERVLTGTTGFFVTPLFRAAASGARSARVAADLRFGDVITEATVMEFRDSTTGVGAQLRINPADKLRLCRFGGFGTYLTATAAQNINGFNETEAAVFIADVNGTGELKKNGVANGSFTGDTLETTPAGIDSLKFFGIPEGHSIRRVIDVYANAAASAISATAGLGGVNAVGRPATSAVNVARTALTGAVSAVGRPVGTSVRVTAGLGAVTALGREAGAHAAVRGNAGLATVSAAGHAPSVTILAYTFHIFRNDYEAGIPVDFPLIIAANQVASGASDALFTGAQSNGGDLRAFMANGAAAAMALGQWDKTNGKLKAAMRSGAAIPYGDLVAIRTGGTGSMTYPSAGDALGEQAVFTGTGAVFFTFGDYSKNVVSGGVFVKDGSTNGDGGAPLAVADINGLSATGFGATDGTNSFDGADLSSMQYPSAMKMVALLDLNSQGGVAGPGNQRGRILHGFQQGPEINFNAGTMGAELEYDVNDGAQQRNFTWALPTFGSPFVFEFSFDGSGSPSSLPTVKYNGVSQTVTDTTSIDQTGKTALNTTGPICFGNHWNGHDRNTDGIMSAMILGDAAWDNALMTALRTQFAGPQNFLKKVSSVSVIPSFTPSKLAEAYNASLSAPLSDAHLKELDELFIREIVRKGYLSDIYRAWHLSSRGAVQASQRNIFAPGTGDLTVFSGSPAFTANAGTATTAGNSDAYDLGMRPGLNGVSRDNFAILLFTLDTTGAGTAAVAARGAASQTYAALNPRDASDFVTGRMGVNANMTTSPTTHTSPGLRTVSATASNARALYVGATQVATDSAASNGDPTDTLIYGGLRTGAATATYRSTNAAFLMLTKGLSATKVADINTMLANLAGSQGII